ncbi:MAG: NADH:flavin oxidoreductase/NADH oxidase [SAR202 cluster bacterium]|nr:NADH:flavin oxidoreductase/NADH oxidase [SAR202 cluster bacterium]
MPHLFDPLEIRGVALRNRIGVSPMCMYSSSDGFANEWHMVHLGARAIGGAALVLTEATAVEPRGRISPQDLGIWSDNHIQPLKEITQFISGHGAIPGMQLAHAGRKAGTSPPWEGNQPLNDNNGGWTPVGPSNIPFNKNHREPNELNLEEISEITSSFSDAAIRAKESGMQWLELHAAHGYLLHQFLSPISNTRDDQYGGTFENRIRLTIETVQSIRNVWPDNYPLAIRLSTTDWIEGGWTVEDTIKLVHILKELGVDLIDCSSGGSSPNASIPRGAGFQVPFAERIRRETEMTTAAVGFITEPMQADEIIRNQRADLVLLGREMLRDPYWPQRASRELDQRDNIAIPSQYNQAEK